MKYLGNKSQSSQVIVRLNWFLNGYGQLININQVISKINWSDFVLNLEYKDDYTKCSEI
jgi:hypothetical protein